MSEITLPIVKNLCEKYASKYTCDYSIEQSKTTKSIYIKFYLAKQGNKFTIRLSDHCANKKRYKGATINSNKKTSLQMLESMIKNKFKKHLPLRVQNIIQDIKKEQNI